MLIRKDSRSLSETPSAQPPTDGPHTGDMSGDSAAVRAFHSGQVVSERYRIVRFVAEGGIGEVYEADDLLLRTRVALKTIRPSSAGAPTNVERLRREISLARKVAHPNVCRVYDFGRHEDATSGGLGVTYLTMEFLEGETLAQRVVRQGRLSASESISLVEQMVEGLSAAHRHGVIHRDFKSANVMLVPNEMDPARSRVVITDFGSARSALPVEGLKMSLTQTGAFIGTPAYMAPEQIAGGPVTPAADLYALGVVLYEMLTGRLPYSGGSAISVAVRRLREAPIPPREITPEIDPVWESVILKCLEISPADRFHTADAVVDALRDRRVVSLYAMRRRRWRAVLIAGAALLLALVSTLAGIRMSAWLSRPSERGRAISRRPSVAILPFVNASGSASDAWLSTALAEMTATELAAGEKLRVLPGDAVARLRPDLPATPDLLDKMALARIRSGTGADIVLTGSYSVSGDRIRVDIRAQDAESGLAMVPRSGSGQISSLFSVVSTLGRQLRESFGAGGESDESLRQSTVALPTNPAAAKLYSEGLSRLRLYDALSARDLLEKAVEIEPGFALGHDALSAAWAALGWDTKSREAAGRAHDLSASLPRELQLRVEARYRESCYEWLKACDIWRGLATMFPDAPEYQLSLAADLTKAGAAKEALEVVDSLRRLPAPEHDDPRIDLAEAQAAANISDNKRSLSAARAALQKATATSARRMQVDALLSEGWAHMALGFPADAMAAYEKAEQISAELGDRDRMAVALVNIGMCHAQSGALAKAKQAEEKAIEIFREVGDKKGLSRALYYVGHALYLGDDLLGAKRAYEEEIALCKETGMQLSLQTAEIALATVLDQLGDLPEAMRMYKEGAEGGRSMANMNIVASCLMNAAIVALDIGDLATADRLMPEALKASRESGDKSQLAAAIFDDAELLAVKGRTADARARYEEALSMWKDIGQKASVADARVSLATLMIAGEDFGGAAALAGQAADEARAAGSLSTECAAAACQARALLAHGSIEAARQALDRASRASAKITNPRYRLLVDISAARLLGMSRQKADALAKLRAVREETSTKHLIRLHYESGLAIAAVLIEARDTQRALEALQELEKDAGARGYVLYVELAHRMKSLRIPPTNN